MIWENDTKSGPDCQGDSISTCRDEKGFYFIDRQPAILYIQIAPRSAVVFEIDVINTVPMIVSVWSG